MEAPNVSLFAIRTRRNHRHMNLQCSPSLDMLREIRQLVALKAAEAGRTINVAVTGPWQGALPASLEGLDINLTVVTGSPTPELKASLRDSDAKLVNHIPEGTDLLVIDSALLGEANKDAVKAIELKIPVVIVHNTNPKLAVLPAPIHSGAEAASTLHSAGYFMLAYQSPSLEGGRRGLVLGAKGKIEPTPTEEPVNPPTDEIDLPTDEIDLPTDEIEPPVDPSEIERARKPSGRFKADDPATPDVDEAWVGGVSPKTAAKKTVAKKAAAKKAAKKVAKKRATRKLD